MERKLLAAISTVLFLSGCAISEENSALEKERSSATTDEQRFDYLTHAAKAEKNIFLHGREIKQFSERKDDYLREIKEASEPDSFKKSLVFKCFSLENTIKVNAECAYEFYQTETVSAAEARKKADDDRWKKKIESLSKDNSYVDMKKLRNLCEIQVKFMFFSTIASTGRNMMLNSKTGKGYEYVRLGEELLLTDKEIGSVVQYYKVNPIAARIIYSNNDYEGRTRQVISCMDSGGSDLITYHRLIDSGKL
ncbi:hypothetical protein PSI23_17510 [Xenorhabdus sp. XENO-10]|uniref:Lipoprotein n=1 Tax=Xenorhabdus yunnanensis TaxID=3025878 RepID=A0ABT5LIV8_9GAMM|nr:hypothetical protein [Xenorhabdus yunnanensis]MDC9591034.1 hypothetical protein [Xenorhabdus yunnanensis]